MIAKKSPLILKEFVIMESVCEAIASAETGPDFNFKETQNNYPVNIEFRITESESNDIIGVFIDIVINENKQNGYFISVKGAGLFSFDESAGLSDQDKKMYVQNSGVSICITNLRAFISNITSYLPFGKYNFPSIDMSDLLNQKIESLKNR